MDSTPHHNTFHTIFFDVGGTLVRSPDFFLLMGEHIAPTRADEVSELLRAEFKTMRQDESLPFLSIKEVLERAMRSIAGSYDLPDKSHHAAEYYRDCFTVRAELYDDVIPILTHIRDRGIRMHIISDADAFVLYEELDLFGISSFFDSLIISSEVKGYKPSAPMVEAGLRLCREPLEKNLLVGDRWVDAETARLMGIKSAIVHAAGEEEAAADYTFESLEELRTIIP